MLGDFLALVLHSFALQLLRASRRQNKTNDNYNENDRQQHDNEKHKTTTTIDAAHARAQLLAQDEGHARNVVHGAPAARGRN